jgi:acetyl esterase/lipase
MPVEPPDIHRRMNLAYSDAHADVRRMDVFAPPQAGNGCAILFIHGGGWVSGKRARWHSVMAHFCRLGYVCATVDYRSVPQWTFPAQLEDVRAAMTFLRGRAGEYGFDAARVAALGSSAGGHLASLLALADGGAADTQPAAVVGLCAVLSLREPAPDPRVPGIFHSLMGGSVEQLPDAYRAASPLDLVRPGLPPFLLICGDTDPTTPAAHHQTMCDQLAAHGNRAELLILPGVGHGFGYGTTTPAQQATFTRVEAFLAAQWPSR